VLHHASVCEKVHEGCGVNLVGNDDVTSTNPSHALVDTRDGTVHKSNEVNAVVTAANAHDEITLLSNYLYLRQEAETATGW
jgi:hypothetical protein